jgi:hypothetical protein
MRLARRQPTCLTANAFRIDRALQQLYFSSSLIRPFSTTKCRPQQVASADSLENPISLESTPPIRADDVTPEPDGYDMEKDRAESHIILSQALAALRKKNRGTEYTSFRKVGTVENHNILSLDTEKPESPLRKHLRPQSLRNPLALKSNKSSPAIRKNAEQSGDSKQERRIKFGIKLFRDMGSESFRLLEPSNKVQIHKLNRTKLFDRKNNKKEKEGNPATETTKHTPFIAFRRCLPAFDHLFDAEDKIPGGRTAVLSESNLGQADAVLDYKGYPVKRQIEADLTAESYSTPWVTTYAGLDGLQAYVL